MDYSMGMTDTSGTPTIGRTITPQWANTSDGSWFNDKLDDTSSFGTARWNSRRHFDWDSPVVLDEKTDPLFDTGSVYSDKSYFGGLDTPGSTAAYTDMATQRAQDALYGGLGQYGLGALGVAGLRSAVTGMNPADAITGAIASTLSPNVASNLMGNVVGAATGTKAGWVGNTIAGLASMANPALGMLATAAGPVIGEGIGKITGTRKDENLKEVVENALNSNFMDTATITKDMRDVANLSPAIPDSFIDSYGNLQTLGLSPVETQTNAISSAANLASGQVDARTAYNAQSLTDYGALDINNAALARAAFDAAATSLYGSPIGAYQGVSPVSEMNQIQNYYSLMRQPLQIGVPGTANTNASIGANAGYGAPANMSFADPADPTSYGTFASTLDRTQKSLFDSSINTGLTSLDSILDSRQNVNMSANTLGGISSAADNTSGFSRGSGFTSRDAAGLRGDLSSAGMAAAIAGSHTTEGLGDGANFDGSNKSSNSTGGVGSSSRGQGGGYGS